MSCLLLREIVVKRLLFFFFSVVLGLARILLGIGKYVLTLVSENVVYFIYVAFFRCKTDP